MAMRAGKLRERINIQSFTVTKLSNGEEQRSWSTSASAWAEVETKTERSHTREEHQAHQVNTYTEYDFHCRGLTGVDTTMRVEFEGQLFDIKAVVHEKLLGRMTILHCTVREDNDNDY